jgi:hypothetical protein
MEEKKIPRVYVASPLRGDGTVDRMTLMAYAWRCMRDSLDRGEAPYLPHLLYPRVLDDAIASEREQGIRAGQMWLAAADKLALYTDYGVSKGMEAEGDYAVEAGIEIEVRKIGR